MRQSWLRSSGVDVEGCFWVCPPLSGCKHCQNWDLSLRNMGSRLDKTSKSVPSLLLFVLLRTPGMVLLAIGQARSMCNFLIPFSVYTFGKPTRSLDAVSS